jgi:hypothetical protein
MSVVETATQTTPTTNGISIHQDATAQKELGSPTTELPLLNITPQRTPAKNIIKNEFAHMRSTSNKENMVPGSPLVAAPVGAPQVNLAPGQPETPPEIRPQPADEQKKDDNHDDVEASEATQAEDGQDDSLIGHFENLSVSPKKQKFSELEVVPGAEQLAPEQPTPESLVDQNEKQETDATKPASLTSQDKEKKAPASPVAKKPASASSQADTTKPARKPSVRQSTLSRQSSVVRKSMAPPSRPDPSTTTSIKRTTSVKRPSVRPSIAPRPGSSNSTQRTAPLPPANIPHSKPRPMSMSFPTPAPPSKSTKAATQATFQLPGEAIAAKLKADKEARLQRQAESGGVQKSTYKPPTTQKSTKAPTKATFQLPGEAIAAKLKQEKEERLKRQEESGAGTATAARSTYIPPVVQKSTKPVTKATFQLSSDVFAAKMKAQKEARLQKQKEEEDKKEKERGVFKARPAPKMSKPTAEVRQTTASRARLPSTGTAALGRASSVRDSTTTTTAAKKRLSSFHPSASTTTLPPRATTSFQKRQSIAAPSASTTASKGKEVFSRARESKDKEDREKREKEEAAKKARSEAAEAGRQKSREWAEKKKREERRKTVTAAAVV